MGLKFNPITGKLDVVNDVVAETDPLSVHLNQTTPQTILNGIPLLEATRVIDQNQELVDKQYVDESLSSYVPYTGATADVDLGTHDLTAQTIYRYQIFTYFN